ncbi:MAG: aminodeoxychorismate/anthranilate synthase component II [Elusimicrobia bacterium CG11_big_fil_rev_8_21_14_0_20_64_6]|nr:MAG: aminodeoxychorismate/anthranilate synthase component II [Elusimicrobia bacterium CG11_big_fil_rev_8_21_14_0_20_64_6]
MILLLDNYDSFTYNLYQAVRFLKQECKVVRNDSLTVKKALALRPDGIILSPGPGRPEDAGILLELVKKAPPTIPVLGVCLGHQAIALANGGPVIRAKRLMHGKTCVITHDGKGVFKNLPKRLTVARYHSLVAAEPLPKNMVATARAEDGSLMGLRLIDRPVEGVQFHPESVATPLGLKLLANFVAVARATGRRRR